MTDFSKTWPEEFLFSFFLGFFIFYSWILIHHFLKKNLKNINQKIIKFAVFFHFLIACFLIVIYQNLLRKEYAAFFFVAGSVFGLIKMVKKSQKP
tara:strand:- start:118 stop:402 length:285 start_codon:yes stop_codon:yes gene_type:complete